MRADHRMVDGRVLRPHLGLGFLGNLVSERLRVVVHSHEAIDASLDVVIEALVGRGHVTEQGVATQGRRLQRMKHRPHRRAFAPGHVGMPAVLVTTDFCGLLEADQFGLAGVARDERVDLEVAKAAGERNVRGSIERLLTEEQDLVVKQRLTQLADDLVGKISGEVDAAELSANGCSYLAGGEVLPAKRGDPDLICGVTGPTLMSYRLRRTRRARKSAPGSRSAALTSVPVVVIATPCIEHRGRRPADTTSRLGEPAFGHQTAGPSERPTERSVGTRIARSPKRRLPQ
jgi:hypothetical protein